MTQRTDDFNSRFVRAHINSFRQLTYLLTKMKINVQDIAKKYHKHPSQQVKLKLIHTIGEYAAKFCRYSHYYQPSLFTYPLKDQIYKYKWVRESLAINSAPDKHTKTVLEKDYRTLPGDSAIVFFTGNSALNKGSIVFMHRIDTAEFLTAVTSALNELHKHDF